MNRKYLSKLLVALIAVALIAIVTGCGDSKKESGSTVETNSEGLDINGCKPAERPATKKLALKAPDEKLDRSKTYLAIFSTNCGEFTIELDAKNNPKTAASMAHMVDEGAYDKTWFHRIITDFVIQGGDPLGEGTGDAGYKVTEKPTGKYQINTVAMAKGGDEPPGTSGSQFYVVIGQQGTALPSDYAIAGTVVKGEDTIKRIAGYASAAGDQAGTPTGVAVVTKATLEIK